MGRLLRFCVLAFVCCGLATRAEALNKGTLTFLAGTYRLIGQMPDSGGLYSGTLKLRVQGSILQVTRMINGHTEQGTASLDTATPDKIPVLTAHFELDHVPYTAVYLWRTDLDNYARISGFFYPEKGEVKTPGLEALFVKP